ncbi:GmrSD restriction endonuclease domain-containing protein [Shewanella avicenniae]|uniref:GmrSD restriction endonuclease domain-containing protein n=1 Tax=Shewanella avicenniae TaxID=2814294 RepID=UPI00389B25D7
MCAWQHGADKWSQDRREQFANDQRNLVAVEASLNRSKGDKGLDEWLPPANQCQYIARFLRVLKQYQLNVSATEEAQFSKLRTQCKS